MSEKEKKAIAERFKRAREMAGLTQREAALILKFKNRVTLTYIEKAIRSIKAEEINLICEVFAVRSDWLLGQRTIANLDPEWKAQAMKLEERDREKFLELIAATESSEIVSVDQCTVSARSMNRT